MPYTITDERLPRIIYYIALLHFPPVVLLPTTYSDALTTLRPDSKRKLSRPRSLAPERFSPYQDSSAHRQTDVSYCSGPSTHIPTGGCSHRCAATSTGQPTCHCPDHAISARHMNLRLANNVLLLRSSIFKVDPSNALLNMMTPDVLWARSAQSPK